MSNSEKQPHIIILPSPCFTVGLTYLTLGRCMNTTPSLPINLIFVLSLNSTRFQSSEVQFKCFSANSNLAFRFFAESSGFFTGRLPVSHIDRKH